MILDSEQDRDIILQMLERAAFVGIGTAHALVDLETRVRTAPISVPAPATSTDQQLQVPQDVSPQV